MISRHLLAAAILVFSACKAGEPDGAAALAQETLRWIHASVLVADSLAWKDRGSVGALRFEIDSALDPKRARFAVRISELLSDTL